MIHSFNQPDKKRIMFGIGLCALLVVYVFFHSRLLPLVFGGPVPLGANDLIFRVMIWLFLGLIYLCAVKIEKQPFFLWEEERYTALFYILSIVVLLGLDEIMGVIIGIPFGHSDFSNYHRKLQLINHLSKPSKFLGVVTAAFCEELIFRAYLIPRLQLFFINKWYPIVISALFFSLCHLGYQTMYYVIDTLGIGVLLGYNYQKYHNIKVLIIFHFLLDYYLLILVR